MRSVLTEENYPTEVFWVKLGRILIVAGVILAAMLVLAGPAIGWWVDTRVFPGSPDQVMQVRDESGRVVDTYTDSQDTYSTTLWLLLPYSLYGFLAFCAACIAIGVAVKDATDTLGMRNPFDAIPVNPADIPKIEHENPDPPTRYPRMEVLGPPYDGPRQQRS